jgi:hypothetical protein
MYIAYLRNYHISDLYISTVDNINIGSSELDIPDFLYNKYDLSIKLFDMSRKDLVKVRVIDKLT